MSQNLKIPKQHSWRPWGDHPLVVGILMFCALLGVPGSIITIYVFYTAKDQNKVAASSQDSNPTPNGSPLPTVAENTKKDTPETKEVSKNNSNSTSDEVDTTKRSENISPTEQTQEQVGWGKKEIVSPISNSPKPRSNKIKKQYRPPAMQSESEYYYTPPVPKTNPRCIYNGDC